MSITDKTTMQGLLSQHQIDDPQHFWGPLPDYARMYNAVLSHFTDGKGQGFQMETPDRQKSIKLRVGESVEALNDMLFGFIGDLNGLKKNTTPT